MFIIEPPLFADSLMNACFCLKSGCIAFLCRL